MSPNNEHSKEKFVGRKTELEQFELAISPRNKLKAFLGLGDGVQARVFLPHGIGGMGKTWLSRECLNRARKAGWQSIEIDWERADYRPSSVLGMMDTLSECLKQTCGEKYVQEYLKVRRQEKQVREKVRRLKQENQEKWSTFVETAKNFAEGVGGENGKPAGAVISVVGSVVGLLSAETARAEEDFINWLVESGRIAVDEGLLYTDPNRQLARKLVEALKNAAERQNLLIVFDTCEILSPDFERWLRDALVCPAVESGASLVFIVCGRLDQYHERQVTREDGAKETLKGYADRLSSPPPIAWDMSRFAEPEIVAYLQNYGLEPRAELLAFVQESARGVPYAVQMITDALRQLGVETVKEKFPPDEGTFSPQEMLVQVTRRFLRYCIGDETDYRRVQSLAILRRWDSDVLQAIWGMPDEKSVNVILQQLEVKYGFVLPERKLHEIVRDFVREDLRRSNKAAAQALGGSAKVCYSPMWEKHAAEIVSLEERVSEPRWRNAALDLLNALYWHSEQEAVNFLAARVIECVLFDRDLANVLLESADEFAKSDEWLSLKNRRVLHALKQLVGQETKSAAESFMAREKELALRKLHLAILHILQAGQFYEHGDFQAAFESLLAAEHDIKDSAEPSIPLVLADRLKDIGWKLGWERGQAKPSPTGLQALEHAVSLAPQQGRLYVGLGVMQYGLKHMEEAIASIQLGISMGEEKAWAYNWLGTIYRALQRYDDAMAAYRQAILLDPKYATPHNNLGNVYRDLQRHDEAIAAYGQAILLDPKFAYPHNGLGNVYRDLQRYDDAIAAYGQAILLDPKGAYPHNGLGNAYGALQHYDEAIAAFRQAILLDPKYATPHNGLGNVYGDLQRYDEAIAAYGQAILLDPKFAYPHNGLGNVYYALQRYNEAIAAYGQAILLDPKFAYPHNGLGNVYRALQRYDEAIAAYEQAILLDSKYAYPHNGLGNVYRDLQRYDEAITAYQQAILLDPKDAYPHNNLGNVYRDLQRYDEAIAAYGQAILLDPKDATPHNNLGIVYRALQRYDEAIAAYGQAILLDPKLAYPHNGLGLIYHLQEDYPQALLAYQRAVELAPDDGAYYISLVGVLRRLGREDEAQMHSAVARELIEKENEYDRACFEAICGNADGALRLLAVALKQKPTRVDWARQDPDFEGLRDDPRFRALVGLA